MASLTMDPTLDDKLSYEIFSILESKYLFSNSPLDHLQSPLKPQLAAAAANAATGKVRVLSIDAASDGGILAALSLSRLETLLKKHTSDPAALVADYFDIAAGSGAGGILVAMLFTRGQDGRPLFTAEESLRFLIGNRSKIALLCSNNGIIRRIFRRAVPDVSSEFRKMFSNATLRRDAIKPVLISCFDLLTGSPFMFSRSDAVESGGYDFPIKEICTATCGADHRAVVVKSLDGKTSIRAVGGGVGMGNPTAAAVTHVLNNKMEFPFADGPEDLLVVSLGSAEVANAGGPNRKLSASAAKIARIAGEGAADMVDQSVAMAFAQNSPKNYVRIQANGFISGTRTETGTPVSAAEAALSQRHIETVMFRGKKISDETNGEKIEWLSSQLIQEQSRRKKSSVPVVLIKPAAAGNHRYGGVDGLRTAKLTS